MKRRVNPSVKRRANRVLRHRAMRVLDLRRLALCHRLRVGRSARQVVRFPRPQGVRSAHRVVPYRHLPVVLDQEVRDPVLDPATAVRERVHPDPREVLGVRALVARVPAEHLAVRVQVAVQVAVPVLPAAQVVPEVAQVAPVVVLVPVVDVVHREAVAVGVGVERTTSSRR